MIKAWLMEEESGQGMVEYALILALIAVAAIAAMTKLSGKITTLFDNVGKELETKAADKGTD